jgi:hypothetical protein
MSATKADKIEEIAAAGRKKGAASQAAGQEGVLLFHMIDDKLPQFDGKTR